MADRRDTARERSEVADYYDSNTRRFLAFGGGSRSHAIHRALWGPGVVNADAAANYVNVLLGDAIDALDLRSDSTVLDFGCGVGGTLFALGKRFPGLKLRGVTISEQQFEMARRFSRRRGLGSDCQFHCGDFESIELGIQTDVAIAVESMVHALSTSAFFKNVDRHLKSGGSLIIVDDFVSESKPLNGIARKVLTEFREGWRLSSLMTVPECVEMAAAAGFMLNETRDLSSMIRLTRVRDRVIAAVSPLLRQVTAVPMFANLVGGAALTRGMRAGILSYRWVRFIKR